MAFCTNCGKELIPGQVCECQKNIMQNMQVEPSPEKVSEGEEKQEQSENGSQNPEQKNAQQSFADAKEQSAAFATNIFKLLLDILKNPVSAGRKAVEEGNATVGIAFIVLQGIFTGLFGIMIANKVNGAINNVTYKLGEKAGNLDMLFSDKYESIEKGIGLFKLSYAKCFFISAIGSIALSFVIALIVMLLIMAFRGKTNYNSMLIASGIRCVGMLPVTLLAILVSFVSAWSILIFMLSGIMGIVFLSRTVTAGAELNEDRLPYIMFIVTVVILVIQVLVAVKIDHYLPDIIRGVWATVTATVKDGFDGIFGSMNIDDILEETIEDLIRSMNH